MCGQYLTLVCLPFTDSIKFAVWDDGHGMPMLGGFASFVATSSNMVRMRE